MRLIPADKIRSTLSFRLLVDALEEAHRLPMPEMDDTLLVNEGVSYLVRSALIPNHALGSKMATVFPDNPTNHARPSIHGLYALFDGQDGSPLAVIDGTELTYWKTAADSALAAKYLSRSDAQKLLIIGAGSLAPWLARAHTTVRPSINEIAIWNRTHVKAVKLAETLCCEGHDARPTADLEAAVRQADVITCATLSRKPIVQGAWLRAGAHLDLVGGYQPDMREADDVAALRARVFVDARASTLGKVGDIVRPIAAGVLSERDILADLFDLVRGATGRTKVSDITLFKNAGGAHLDLMVARIIYELST